MLQYKPLFEVNIEFISVSITANRLPRHLLFIMFGIA